MIGIDAVKSAKIVSLRPHGPNSGRVRSWKLDNIDLRSVPLLYKRGEAPLAQKESKCKTLAFRENCGKV